MLTILFLVVISITIDMVLDRTYEFIIGIKILYLYYWTYAQIMLRMDVAFSNPMQYLRSCKLFVIF